MSKYIKYPEELKQDHFERLLRLKIGPAQLIALNEIVKAAKENRKPSKHVDRLIRAIGKGES